MTNEQREKSILENYEKTIQPAIEKAVELTLQENEDVHVTIFMNKRGVVDVSDLTTIDLLLDDKLILICNVDGWLKEYNIPEGEDAEDADNWFDENMKEQIIADKIEEENVIKYLLYPQKE